tara:strand:+ start:62637 stop:63512 length:876 start_codon:yes stop_codon:yes gene_type:complete
MNLEKLRSISLSLSSDGDSFINSEVSGNPTPKRVRELQYKQKKGYLYKKASRIIDHSIEMINGGTLPKEVKLSKKAALSAVEGWQMNDNEKLIRSIFEKIISGKEEEPVEVKLRNKENELVGLRIPGFFPTPRNVIEERFDFNDSHSYRKVLEPSAGKGDIADFIKNKGVEVDVIEINPRLREILKLKGHNIVGDDFLLFNEKYDIIVMNPPFEKGQDIDHVKHAYSLLNEGGFLASIMSTGPFFRSTKKDVEFRNWFERVEGNKQDLESGSFKSGFVPTGVSCVSIFIQK